MDDFKSLETLHQGDFTFYHDEDCEGRVTLRKEMNIEQLSSYCPLCGLLVTSSTAAVYTSKVRTHG